MARVKGNVSVARLKQMAQKTGAPVIYYIISIHGNILKQQALPTGDVQSSIRGLVSFSKRPSLKRFLNYWYAHAYKCQLDQLKRQEEPND